MSKEEENTPKRNWLNEMIFQTLINTIDSSERGVFGMASKFRENLAMKQLAELEK